MIRSDPNEMPRYPAAEHRECGSVSPWKNCFDRVTAGVLLVASLPILALVTVLIRLNSAGPAIVHQARVGRGGRRFVMYSFRTVRLDGPGAVGWTTANGDCPRRTSLGELLSRTHLDGLPRLFNVLKGEMSFVGPRPDRPECVHILNRLVPGYARRLTVAPGLTGLAQLRLPSDSDPESVRRKLALDLEYIHNMGVLLDLKLLALSLVRPLANRSAVEGSAVAGGPQ